jgi:hypothetical protein
LLVHPIVAHLDSGAAAELLHREHRVIVKDALRRFPVATNRKLHLQSQKHSRSETQAEQSNHQGLSPLAR